MPVRNNVWILPRPKEVKYPGGFPLWFEERLLKYLGYDYKEELKDKVLQMFAGETQYGFRVDILPNLYPDLLCDCHRLPDSWTNKFEVTILDPPYNNEYSSSLYNTGKVVYKQYMNEAIRVTQKGGFIVCYHWVQVPRLPGTIIHSRIFVGGRNWHTPRVCTIFKKVISGGYSIRPTSRIPYANQLFLDDIGFMISTDQELTCFQVIFEILFKEGLWLEVFPFLDMQIE